jgi:hypothetical protein
MGHPTAQVPWPYDPVYRWGGDVQSRQKYSRSQEAQAERRNA